MPPCYSAEALQREDHADHRLRHSEGGAGKTPLSASLSVAAAEAGERVIALDLDPQGSLASWGDVREAESPAVDRLPADRLAELPTILAALKGEG
ncbi:ParA family protein, partial [Streptomyces benahoarensis]